MLELAAYLDLIPTFMLAVCRVAGLFLLMPFFADAGVPMRIRALLAAGLTLLIVGQVPPVGYDFPTLPALAIGMGMELAIGLAMGLVVSVMFAGLSMGARLISQQTGMALANVFDPTSNANTPILGQLYTLIATVIFLGINGHLMALQAVIGSFKTIPLMGAKLQPGVVEMLGKMMHGCFVIGIKVAAPALTALLLASVALGFLQRTVPQLNILAVGFPIRQLTGLFMMVATLFVAMTFFSTQLEELFAASSDAMATIGEVLQNLTPS
jgi:flagellar biosynthetic protein FliR